jgi:alkaline phosphatase D
MAEAFKHRLKGHPLRPLFVSERQPGQFESTINLTVKHGVRSALEYARTGSLQAAHAVSNPDNAPHLEFVDMGGHGYAVVTAADGGRSPSRSPAGCASTDPGWRPAALQS